MVNFSNDVLATSRTMIAFVEQYQQRDSSIAFLKVLRKHMNGLERIEGALNPLKV